MVRAIYLDRILGTGGYEVYSPEWWKVYSRQSGSRVVHKPLAREVRMASASHLVAFRRSLSLRVVVREDARRRMLRRIRQGKEDEIVAKVDVCVVPYRGGYFLKLY